MTVAAAMLYSPAPAGPVPAPPTVARTSLGPIDEVSVLRERAVALRAAASRRREREALRLWPSEGLHTGWWGERRGGRLHGGIDIDGNTGDPISSAARGTVTHAGPAPDGYGGYGLVVMIDHGDFTTLYAHLSRVDVAAGQIVDAGQLIGLMGTTGAVTGSHLHFEVRVGGVPVDPGPYMPPSR